MSSVGSLHFLRNIKRRFVFQTLKNVSRLKFQLISAVFKISSELIQVCQTVERLIVFALFNRCMHDLAHFFVC